MTSSPWFPVLLFVGSALAVAAWAGTLGVIFILLNRTALHDIQPGLGAIIIGLALIALVPAIAGPLSKRLEGEGGHRGARE